jgi:hypothetical protein
VTTTREVYNILPNYIKVSPIVQMPNLSSKEMMLGATIEVNGSNVYWSKFEHGPKHSMESQNFN